MVGRTVGNYKILEKIGEGGMGAVFRAIDFMVEREVALKMRPELSRSPDFAQRFRREASALGRLTHPNIATLHTFFRQGDDLFMVMEFVRGETLSSKIARSGALPCEEALPLFSQILDAIGYAHSRGIVHRDIKPSNVMITSEGLVKVMDFGIARVLGGERLTKTGGNHRHYRVHVAGADHGQRGRPSLRHLLAGRPALRNADGAPPIYRCE